MRTTNMISELINDAEQSQGDDRLITLSMIADIALNLSSKEAYIVAQYFLLILHGPNEPGRSIALAAVTEIIGKFRKDPIFREMAANIENEIALCCFSAQGHFVQRRAMTILSDHQRRQSLLTMSRRLLGGAV